MKFNKDGDKKRNQCLHIVIAEKSEALDYSILPSVCYCRSTGKS